ncbi:hypothetical protein XFF6970_890039 [Xanthomonas citri pv. fuscans]|nr:hypothetical protein XFF6970_890039 [Xanthomonas citri pv. fuscans]
MAVSCLWPGYTKSRTRPRQASAYAFLLGPVTDASSIRGIRASRPVSPVLVVAAPARTMQ